MNSIKYIDLFMKINELNKNQKLSSHELKLLQEKKFKKLLAHALTHSKFYKNYYGERGITIDKINEISLEDLPIIDKKIVMENYDDLICDQVLKRKDVEEFINNPSNVNKKYKNNYNVICSSGSSGEVGIFAYSLKEWNYIKALNIQRTSKSKLRLFSKIKVAFIGNVYGNYAGVSLTKELPKLFTKTIAVNINSPIGEIRSQVDKFQPEILTGYASGIFTLAQEQLKGNINIKPTKILCSGEVLNDHMRSEIKNAFGIEPINLYAASESLGMASECQEHNKLHLFTDLYKFEVVDKELKPVLPGNSGNLILTNLFNYTQPLIRYRMNDEVILDDNLCECGSPFPILKSISGRQDEFLWFEKSDATREFIHPSIIRGSYVDGVDKIKVIQTSMNSLLIKAISNGKEENIINNIKIKINEILQSKGLDKDVTFSVEIVSKLENDKKTGKYKLIVPFK
ncbi:phenylacetate--CoA ligase family protein [Clostridium vincentii]|uniref:Phenylacetate-coenzyme A ligase n=1 Tax=Clostridium vincentii TaxID=52704 RepID=A0A2T0BB35_9CLOT|nr:phenylacetate--CoA ligase family protein [Clostridium vincentii]PRR81055.1 Phenylacetate-coenzyme A ligase [Clostridium vincentii]